MITALSYLKDEHSRLLHPECHPNQHEQKEKNHYLKVIFTEFQFLESIEKGKRKNEKQLLFIEQSLVN